MSRETGPYDPNGTPKAARAWFAQADLIRKGEVVRRGKRGPQKAPTKKLVSLRLSAEVVEHFKFHRAGLADADRWSVVGVYQEEWELQQISQA